MYFESMQFLDVRSIFYRFYFHFPIVCFKRSRFTDVSFLYGFQSHEGFTDWNIGTKNIEFSINVNGFEVMTAIDSDNLESLEYEV